MHGLDAHDPTYERCYYRLVTLLSVTPTWIDPPRPTFHSTLAPSAPVTTHLQHSSVEVRHHTVTSASHESHEYSSDTRQWSEEKVQQLEDELSIHHRDEAEEEQVAVQKDEGREQVTDLQPNDDEVERYHAVEEQQEVETQREIDRPQYGEDTELDCDSELADERSDTVDGTKQRRVAGEHKTIDEELREIADETEETINEEVQRELTDEEWTWVAEDEQKIEKRWTVDEAGTRIADEEQKETAYRQEHIGHENTHAMNDYEDRNETQIAPVLSPDPLPPHADPQPVPPAMIDPARVQFLHGQPDDQPERRPIVIVSARTLTPLTPVAFRLLSLSLLRLKSCLLRWQHRFPRTQYSCSQLTPISRQDVRLSIMQLFVPPPRRKRRPRLSFTPAAFMFGGTLCCYTELADVAADNSAQVPATLAWLPDYGTSCSRATVRVSLVEARSSM